MMVSNIILIFSFLLDGILSNFLPFMTSDLSIFTPLLTVTSLVIIYPFYKKNNKKFLITAFILGIIYDLFYTNLLLLNGFIFLVLGEIIILLNKEFGDSHLKNILHIFIIIVLYELLTSIIIVIFNLVPISIDKVLYKISHSLLLNLIYGELFYIVLKLIPKKYLKVCLN